MFVQDLHGEVVPSLLVFHQHHPPEGACAEGLDSIKVIQTGCILWMERLRESGTLFPVACWANVWGIISATSRGGPGEQGERWGENRGQKSKMAEGTFLEASGRGQIWPWPGAQELLAAVWGAGATSCRGWQDGGAWQWAIRCLCLGASKGVQASSTGF